MQSIPRHIPGSKTSLSSQVVVSILLDRTMVLEIGKSAVVFLSPEEASALKTYLARHARKFQTGGQQ